MSVRRFVVGLCVLACLLLVVSASAFASAPETPGSVRAEEIKANSVTLRGVLNPNTAGEAGTYEFLYKASATECQGSSSQRGLSFGFIGEEVSQELQGLSPNTQYSVCLLARALGGETSVGPVSTFKTALPPETPVTEKASSVTAHSAVLHGLLNPSSPGEAGSYSFEYANSANSCQGDNVSSGVSAGGLEREAVSSEVTGLLPNTIYSFCVIARNTARETAQGGAVTFTTLSAPPTLSEVSAQQIGTTEATLTASIDPWGATTSYHVEYGPSLPYTSSTPAQSVYPGTFHAEVHLSNLQPGVLYHYKFIATNSLGSTESTDNTLRTSPALSSSSLPDGRVYERVSALAPYGAEAYVPDESVGKFISTNTELPFEASVNGERVVYVGAPTVGGNELAGQDGGNEYLATRSSPGGWVQVNISPFEASTGVFQAFSKDLTVGFLDADEPLSAQAPGFGASLTSKELFYPGNYDVLYSTDLGSGKYDPFFTVTPPFRSKANFETVASDFYHAGIQDHGSGARGVRVLLFAGASADSSHVLFLANDALTGASEGRPAAEGGPGTSFQKENNLYETVDGQLRLVNVLPDGTTHVNATFGTPLKGEYQSILEAPGVQSSHVISSDGSRVFWTDLTTGHIYVRENGATTAEVSSAGAYQTASSDGSVVFYTNGDLYEYEVDSGHTTDLTPGVAVTRVLGASEDGSYVYYLTTGGEVKLWHDGVTTSVSSSGALRAEVTPDGHGIVFQSGRSLYSSLGRINVYDADTGTLYCASCSSAGTEGFLPMNMAPSVNETRWISADGGRVFFMTPLALVPQDTNSNNDVYEWERPGVGGCLADGSSEGCLYLLSSGTNRDQSFFLDASESGNDVFIDTRAKLVGSDEDDLFDVYDVRVDGYTPPAPAACTGSGCQGVPGAPPIFATPSSVTFEGVGNFAPSPPKSGPVSKTKQKKPSHKKKQKKKQKKKSKSKESARKAGARKHSGAKGVRS